MNSEVDVNTATPNSANAAGTWAGWAVSAVTSKFYRGNPEKTPINKTIAKLSSQGNFIIDYVYDLLMILQ
jgi:hypothetical protein